APRPGDNVPDGGELPPFPPARRLGVAVSRRPRALVWLPGTWRELPRPQLRLPTRPLGLGPVANQPLVVIAGGSGRDPLLQLEDAEAPLRVTLAGLRRLRLGLRRVANEGLVVIGGEPGHDPLLQPDDPEPGLGLLPADCRGLRPLLHFVAGFHEE